VFRSALVNLYTHDIGAAVEFYRDLLGFKETFRTPLEGVPEHVELRLDGFTLGLGTAEAARRAHGVEASPATRRWRWSCGATTSIARTRR
jgi:lactoylglutathione lyase